MFTETNSELILGLDLGASSVGWALIKADHRKPTAIVDAGVRVFDAGMEGNFASGRATPRNTGRREARQRRRMLRRRVQRMNKLANLLHSAGLMSAEHDPKSIRMLDNKILETYLCNSSLSESLKSRLPHVLPYWLRARALNHELPLHELGRALYHLAQRRGYLSNRKAPESEDRKKEEGAVKQGIAKLQEEMGFRTLGEYFSTLDPSEERIRKRWTARTMYMDEFERIWTAQSAHYPTVLTTQLKEKIHHAIFYQRPLKSAKSLIGKCQLEPKRSRAPWTLLSAQRFRLLQQINHTEILHPDGEIAKLQPEQRQVLIAKLETQGELKFSRAKKILGLNARHVFTTEESGGEKRFVGNRTASKLKAIFGERWGTLSQDDRERIVEDVMSIQNDSALKKRAQRVWGLDDEDATKLTKVSLESGYCNLSRQAIAKLLPFLEKGVAYATAVKEVYGALRQRTEPATRLPQVAQVLPHLRNPVVHRVLTELRKVVNAVIARHGKPAMIHIELARDMRRTAKQRQKTWKRNRANETARKKAAARILEEVEIHNPSRTDIEKVLLADECGWECPYTGKQIGMTSLLGDHPQFDIEHIIPFSRCLDNSFVNKTLCDIRENRNVKRNMTPYEAYAGDDTTWDDILARVRKFKSSAAYEKLRRFMLKDIQTIDDFTTQQLNDTRYASKQAMNYVGLLYGGTSDEEGKLRVQGSRGGTTFYLRNEWSLNALLGDGGAKSRDDHRHHAVDAIVIALTDPGIIKAMSDAAARAPQEGRRLFGAVKSPWSGFFDEVKERVATIHVSHRISRKVNGRLHEDTFYGKPRVDPNGKPCVHVRKAIENLSRKEVEMIVDPHVRQRVRDKLDELGGDPKKFTQPGNKPFLKTKDKRRIPITTARIRKYETTFTVGTGNRQRRVTTDTNHHIEIIKIQGKRGVKWDWDIVNQYKAMRRHARGEPIVKRDHGKDKRFVFSLCSGEIIEIDAEHGGRELVVIRTVSGGNVEFASLADARKKEEIKKAKDWKKRSVERLRQLHCQKVTITPLGEIRHAND